MINSTGTPPARLITVFGTVIYYDTASGQLRHGAVESCPANAWFMADPSQPGSQRRGWLIHSSGQSYQPIVCLADRCEAVAPSNTSVASAAGTLLDLTPLERGLVALGSEDRFLSADPGGRIYLSVVTCSTWECFLASESWCTDELSPAEATILEAEDGKFDRKRIQSHIIHPLIRARAHTRPKARRVLIYGYPRWSHGRVYYDLAKFLHRLGYIVDILNWQEDHAAYVSDLFRYYELFISALDGVRTLVDVYGVPYDKIIAISHHELDMRMLTEQKGRDIFEKFANYGVVSYFLYCASLMQGIVREPMVASLGINYREFYAQVPERLTTVGYASSMSVKTFGVEWKRGQLAEAAALKAGLAFKVAGSTGNQISFHDMPAFYRTVEAMVTSSISEAAQLPVLEAAAAGRLVIGTPVGHFPLRAYQGGGIIAPVEKDRFVAFVADTLRYYKENPSAYIEKCTKIREAARKFDWQYCIGEWVELMEAT